MSGAALAIERDSWYNQWGETTVQPGTRQKEQSMSVSPSEEQLVATITSLEARVAALEAEVADLKQERLNGAALKKPWWEEIRGTFKDDPLYDEAMRLGRKYRQSLRP
jgi:uncharacterized small protein (DUF1192 family)